jgi:diadenylate cyclase
MTVDGVGEQRARAVREGLSRLAESSILERYV